MRRVVAFAALGLAACSQAGEAPPSAHNAVAAEAPSSPDGDRQLLWGDTHVHTANSVDAFMSGAANADIDTAYRFARGLPVINPRTGARIRIDRPLDFIVVSDHAENLGISMRVVRRDPGILGLPFGQRLRQIYDEKGGRAVTSAMMGGQGLTPEELAAQTEGAHLPQVLQAGWDAQVDAAEKYNEPGVFTAMIGWEWTSAPNMRNLHRVVFTDANGDVAKTFVPFANWMSDKPEDLWSFQVIKGWVDARGQTHEKIFDVVWSGSRQRRADGTLPPLVNHVDVAHARNDLTAGAAELTAFWRDPEFDRTRGAFYYVRVIQAPTLRHHVYDALALGIDPTTLEFPATIQERAWSSPVWYRP